MSFESLGLKADLLRAVREQGYTDPTPIQLKAIPLILKGEDVLAGAQTGTGKTAAFTLPMLQILAAAPPRKERRRPVRCLVLCPTRELAAQVEESIITYGRHMPMRSAVIFGGVKIGPQIDRLRDGVDVLVATPGRLLDHVGQGTVDLSKVEILVLDEADRMLDMGFIHDIRKVLALLPDRHDRQSLLFSATFSDDIKALADRLLDNPIRVEVAGTNSTADRVDQIVYPVDKARKRELLTHLITSGGWSQVLVFARTKHGSNRLAQQLQKDGLNAAAIHGNKSQAARTRALAQFKSGEVRVLVATDIAARGLDIDLLPHVVNYELPNVAEDYVHRIGRTGRAGNEGEATSLVCVDELGLLKDIEKLLGRPLPQRVLAGWEPDPTIAPEPIQRGREGRGGRSDGPRGGGPRGSGRGPRTESRPRPEGGRRREGGGEHSERPWLPEHGSPPPSHRPTGTPPSGGRTAGGPSASGGQPGGGRPGRGRSGGPRTPGAGQPGGDRGRSGGGGGRSGGGRSGGGRGR